MLQINSMINSYHFFFHSEFVHFVSFMSFVITKKERIFVWNDLQYIFGLLFWKFALIHCGELDNFLTICMHKSSHLKCVQFISNYSVVQIYLYLVWIVWNTTEQYRNRMQANCLKINDLWLGWRVDTDITSSYFFKFTVFHNSEKFTKRLNMIYWLTVQTFQKMLISKCPLQTKILLLLYTQSKTN